MSALLEKMKKKCGISEMSDHERDAKMGVVKHMRDEASKQMLGKMKKPKDMMSEMPKDPSENGEDLFAKATEGDEIQDSTENMEGENPEEMSEEDLDAKLAELMALKEKMKGQKA